MTLEELRGKVELLASRNTDKMCFGTLPNTPERSECYGYNNACDDVLKIIREAEDGGRG